MDVRDLYRQIFKLAAESAAVKTAGGLLNVLKHPAVAYGLGAAALGVGLPTAYAMGQQTNQEEVEKARQAAFAQGIAAATAPMQYAPASTMSAGLFPDAEPPLDLGADYDLGPDQFVPDSEYYW